jgi:toxin ParE1/3/4
MRVEFSKHVEPDLEAIAGWIAAGSLSRAVSFIQELRLLIRLIGRSPQIFRLRPEIRPDIRIATHGRYVILFRIHNEVVRIERVVYGARNLFSLLEHDD